MDREKDKRMKSIRVSAAVIHRDGKILATQRGYGEYKGKWEFPGGKIESGETKEEAIVREIKEELNMDIKVDSSFDEKIYEYPDKTIKLIALNCSMISDSYEVLEHEDIKWISEDEFKAYEFAPADVYFIEKIVKNIA